MAGGAEVDGVDVLGAEAGGQELGAVGFAEVEEDAFGRGLVAGRHHVEPLDGVGLVAGAEFVEVGGGIGRIGRGIGWRLRCRLRSSRGRCWGRWRLEDRRDWCRSAFAFCRWFWRRCGPGCRASRRGWRRWRVFWGRRGGWGRSRRFGWIGEGRGGW